MPKKHDVFDEQTDKSVVIVFPCSDFFVPYFMVALQSLIECSNSSRKYKIFIMESNVSEINKKRIKSVVQNNPNIIIDFYNMNNLIKNVNFVVFGHLSKETFFKLCIPKIFHEYDRVLFCDSDTVFMDDPAKLFDMDIGNKKIGAALCLLINGVINKCPEKKDYFVNVLGLKDVDKYMQAGVIIFNNKLISDADIDNMFASLDGERYEYLDQDILNKFFQNDVFFFGNEWNYETPQKCFDDIVEYISPKFKKLYKDAEKNPKIIHYCGERKPWLYPDEVFADVWWQYARRSLCYKDILNRRAKHIVEFNFVSRHLSLVKSYLFVLRVLRHWFNPKSEARKRLGKKYDYYKGLMNDIIDIKKHH